jgi:peptidoglycan/xylan/chitin deacetylase (PgdA/CDA1 family)
MPSFHRSRQPGMPGERLNGPKGVIMTITTIPLRRTAALLVLACVIAASLTLGGRSRPAAATPAAKQSVVVHTAVSNRPVVYLTFDDGPNPTYTPQILAVLSRYGAHATFFQIGQQVRDHGALTRAVRARGHSVQNHTWSHPDLTKVSWPRFVAEVVNTDRAIYAQLRYKPRCLRPPYGARNRLTATRAAALGKQLKLWTIDTRDWQRPGAATIAGRALTSVHSGSIILMHDGGGNRSQTVAATATIVRTLKSRGYVFGTLWC